MCVCVFPYMCPGKLLGVLLYLALPYSFETEVVPLSLKLGYYQQAPKTLLSPPPLTNAVSAVGPNWVFLLTQLQFLCIELPPQTRR